VIGAPHPDFGEGVVAVIVGEVTAEAIGAALKERLAGYKRPKLVRMVDALPRNAMGKVEKAALRRELADVFG
jgi:malonyl-CoA/methylmalonyl-CoA synthetase